MKSDKKSSTDTLLTVQVFSEARNPRSFKLPMSWIHRASIFAWLLVCISIFSVTYAVKAKFSSGSAEPELIQELQDEIQTLTLALEKKGVATPTPIPSSEIIRPDPKAVEQRPDPAPGEILQVTAGSWNGLAENIDQPKPNASIQLEDPRVQWKGSEATFAANIIYKNPGKGSQQGKIVVLARSSDQLSAYPQGVLNTASNQHLFNPEKGEYFSVARFRVLKAQFSPLSNSRKLTEFQVFLFDQDHHLILSQTFLYGGAR